MGVKKVSFVLCLDETCGWISSVLLVLMATINRGCS